VLDQLNEQLEPKHKLARSTRRSESEDFPKDHVNDLSQDPTLGGAELERLNNLDASSKLPPTINASRTIVVNITDGSEKDTRPENSLADSGPAPESNRTGQVESNWATGEQYGSPTNDVQLGVRTTQKSRESSASGNRPISWQQDNGTKRKLERLDPRNVGPYSKSFAQKASRLASSTTAIPMIAEFTIAPRRSRSSTTARSLALDKLKELNHLDDSGEDTDLGTPLFSMVSSKHDLSAADDQWTTGKDFGNTVEPIRSGRYHKRPKEARGQQRARGYVEPEKTIEYTTTESTMLSGHVSGDGDDMERGNAGQAQGATNSVPPNKQSEPHRPRLSPSEVHLHQINGQAFSPWSNPNPHWLTQLQQQPLSLFKATTNAQSSNSREPNQNPNGRATSDYGQSVLFPAHQSSSPRVGGSQYQLGTASSGIMGTANLSPASTVSSTNQYQNADLLNQPQTIQITALPNGATGSSLIRISGLPVANGVAPLNQLQPINGFGNGLGLDPFGRQLFMVGQTNQQAERRQVDWSIWIWPIVAAITLPIILAALFVPIFLKTIVVLIQILQSLGLLLPLASALGQNLAQATGSGLSGVLGQLDNQTQHQQHSQVQQIAHQQQQVHKLAHTLLANS